MRQTGWTGIAFCSDSRFRLGVQKLTDLNFNKKSFLSNFGIELRMQMFSFYRMPMIGFFQFAMPLTRDVRDRNFPDETDRVDRHRILFGFSI